MTAKAGPLFRLYLAEDHVYNGEKKRVTAYEKFDRATSHCQEKSEADREFLEPSTLDQVGFDSRRTMFVIYGMLFSGYSN